MKEFQPYVITCGFIYHICVCRTPSSLQGQCDVVKGHRLTGSELHNLLNPFRQVTSRVPMASSVKWLYINNHLAQRGLERYKESNIDENIL